MQREREHARQSAETDRSPKMIPMMISGTERRPLSTMRNA